MKALKWNKKELQIIDLPVPEPKDDEALIRVSLAGICNTDIEITKGYFDFEGILGHEFVGFVDKCSDKNLIGKRVVCDINCACYECETCRENNFHHCPNRSVIGISKKDGAFAEYICVPIKNLTVVPDEVSDQMAVFAEPIAAALEIQEQIQIKTTDRLCVLGDGKLGLLIAMTLSSSGFDVTLTGHHPENLSRLGDNIVNYALKPSDRMFDIVIEATGNPEGLLTAQKIVLPRGKIVLKSTYKNSFEFNPSLMVVNEIKMIGSRCGPIDKAIEILKESKIDPTTLIHKTYPLSEGIEAMKQAQNKGVLKILIDTAV